MQVKNWDSVRCYWNFHRKLFSVQAKVDGRWLVVAHTAYLELDEATFHVNENGRQRVLRERKKNVHAKIHGRVVAIDQPSLFGKHFYENVTYNPYKNEHFISDITHSKITRCGNLRLRVVDGRSELIIFHTDYL